MRLLSRGSRYGENLWVIRHFLVGSSLQILMPIKGKKYRKKLLCGGNAFKKKNEYNLMRFVTKTGSQIIL